MYKSHLVDILGYQEEKALENYIIICIHKHSYTELLFCVLNPPAVFGLFIAGISIWLILVYTVNTYVKSTYA